MANPQIENGHVDIAHEIAEAFARTRLSSAESKVLWAIMRKTWGWHKKRDRISYTQFEELTSMNRRHIAPVLTRLIDRKIITRTGNGHKLEYGIQKDYEKWTNVTDIRNVSLETLPKHVTKANVTEMGNTPLPKSVMKTLPKSVNTKETKETIQKQASSNIQLKIITKAFKEHVPETSVPEKVLSHLLEQYGVVPLTDAIKWAADHDADKPIPYIRQTLKAWQTEGRPTARENVSATPAPGKKSSPGSQEPDQFLDLSHYRERVKARSMGDVDTKAD